LYESIQQSVGKMALNQIRDTLMRPRAQRQLVNLYRASQTECKRAEKLGMEVGNSRENDQKAVLKYHIPALSYKISNHLPQDFELDGEPVSQKHITAKVGKGNVKAKWTSDKVKAGEYIAKMITGDPTMFTHLLLTYIDIPSKLITVIGIDREKFRTSVVELKEESFTHHEGTNTRGVEYSVKLMKKLLDDPAFKVEINNVDLSGGIDPIERRIKLLELWGDE